MKRILLISLALCINTGTGWGTEIVYTPINPSFGGNPQNGGFLLSSAEAQNKFTAPKTPVTVKDPIDTFKDMLLNRALNTLSSRIIDEAFGTIAGGSTGLTGGHYTFGTYTIDVISTDPSAITVSIADSSTGRTTTVEVPAYAELSK